jgi:hypothetical protein
MHLKSSGGSAPTALHEALHAVLADAGVEGVRVRDDSDLRRHLKRRVRPRRAIEEGLDHEAAPEA